MGISERKEREREERKLIIQKTAIELFLSNGFENVTIRKIAEKIEYSPATIYLYFKDKADILMALHREGFKILSDYQKKAFEGDDTIFEKIKKMGMMYVGFAMENPEYYNLIFVMSYKQKGLSSPDEWEEGRFAYDLLRQSVVKCIEEKYFASADVEITTFTIWAFIHGVTSLVVGQNGGPVEIENPKVFVSNAIEKFFNNLK